MNNRWLELTKIMNKIVIVGVIAYKCIFDLWWEDFFLEELFLINIYKIKLIKN